MLKKNQRILISGCILLGIVLLPSTSEAQTKQDTSVQSFSLTPVIKSVFVPGWGQVHQDRLPEAMLFYFSAANYYYRTIFHWDRNRKNTNTSAETLFKVNLSAALFLHGLNVLDVLDSEWRHPGKTWQGGLLDDRPLKSPWGAAFRSAMVPGWGQLYNESYWKAAGYLLVDSYLVFKIRESDLSYKRSGLTTDKDERSRYSWYFGLAYFLTMADAYAGAYLFRFDEAMRLTLTPVIQNDAIALGFYVYF